MNPIESESSGFDAHYPCQHSSVAQARAGVGRWCQDAGIDADLIPDVQLATSEAATNAVRHSGCYSFAIAARLDPPVLVVSVHDRGIGMQAPDPGSGLGLKIIRGLTDSTEIEHTDPGTRITMRFSRSG